MPNRDDTRVRYCVQHENHARFVLSAMCSLMEHQAFVDLAIRCGNKTVHAHKCVLAANSPYFRDQLDKNPGTEQVIVSGVDFAVMKAIVEFMYCGETQIIEEHLQPLSAVAKLFQMRGLPGIAQHSDDYDSLATIAIPPPIFLSNKPKYSSTYTMPTLDIPQQQANAQKFDQIETSGVMHPENTEYTFAREKINAPTTQSYVNDINFNNRYKRRFVLPDALQDNLPLRVPMSSDMATQGNYVTVNSNDIQFMSASTTNVAENNLTCATSITPIEPIHMGDFIEPPVFQRLTEHGNNNYPKDFDSRVTPTSKIKTIFGQELSENVEIMYKTAEGQFLNVTEDMLHAISKEAFQFQVIDENGQAGEVQLLQSEKPMNATQSMMNHDQLRTQDNKCLLEVNQNHYGNMGEDETMLREFLIKNGGCTNTQPNNKHSALNTQIAVKCGTSTETAGHNETFFLDNIANVLCAPPESKAASALGNHYLYRKENEQQLEDKIDLNGPRDRKY